MKNREASTELLDRRTHVEKYLHAVVEYGMYLYFFMFWYDMGESIRNVALYSSLTGWVTLALLKKRFNCTTNIITLSFLAYLGSVFLSTFFSIDPYYSFITLKHDVLKAVIVYAVVSSSFSEKMFLRAVKVIAFSGFLFLLLGLYDFTLGGMDKYVSQNTILSVDKNKYGFPLSFFLSFYLVLAFIARNAGEKILWSMSGLWAVIAAILSASRGATGSVIIVSLIFGCYFFKRVKLKTSLIVLLVVVLTVMSLYSFLPSTMKKPFSTIPEHLLTFNERTYLFWEPALEAVGKKPVIGWGYGQQIYRNPQPFEDGKQPDWDKKGGMHSAFVNVLFHQGFVGLISYVVLLISIVYVLTQMIINEAYERRIFALSMLSIIIASFFVNSFVKVVPLQSLAIIMGMSASLHNNRTSCERR